MTRIWLVVLSVAVALLGLRLFGVYRYLRLRSAALGV
jgi:hypothetical protein